MDAGRRKFICLTLGAGAALAGGAVATCRRGVTERTRKGVALGAPVTMTAFHCRGDVAEQALDDAFGELRLVDELMSLYRPESQLCRLNRDGCLSDPHPYLVTVLGEALDLSRHTSGAFDVTVHPLWNLNARARRRGVAPSDDELERELRRVDWRRVELSGRRIILRDNSQITLNGIAQGFAADRALAALRRREVAHALVDAGEIGTVGGKDADSPWTVGIQHPRRVDRFLALARLRERCLATSGDYATPFGDGFGQHHIFDPHVGRSPTEFSSVSVAAPTAIEADGLSTALFVLGLERGLQFVRSLPRVDALFVLKDGRTLATDGFPV